MTERVRILEEKLKNQMKRIVDGWIKFSSMRELMEFVEKLLRNCKKGN